MIITNCRMIKCFDCFTPLPFLLLYPFTIFITLSFSCPITSFLLFYHSTLYRFIRLPLYPSYYFTLSPFVITLSLSYQFFLPFLILPCYSLLLSCYYITLLPFLLFYPSTLIIINHITLYPFSILPFPLCHYNLFILPFYSFYYLTLLPFVIIIVLYYPLTLLISLPLYPLLLPFYDITLFTIFYYFTILHFLLFYYITLLPCLLLYPFTLCFIISLPSYPSYYETIKR